MNIDGARAAPLDVPTDGNQDFGHTLHQLNNALTTVLANAQLAGALGTAEPQAAEALEGIVGGARRASELARRLREMVRGPDVSAEVLS